MTTMAMAGQWYGNGTFWAAATVIVAVATLIVGSWVTLRAAHPKRRLTYRLAASAPLVASLDRVREGLVVSRDGVTLTDPHVLQIELANRGRRDIPSSAFDSGSPVRLELGASVISVLEVASTPTTTAAPTVRMDGQALNLAPSLISRGQRVNISALVDGPEPNLRVQAPLIDVDVREQVETDVLEPRRQLFVITVVAVVGVVIIYLTQTFSDVLPRRIAVMFLVVLTVGLGSLMGAAADRLRNARRR